jgi:L-threonylcarbamoyladenylate synthase
VTLTAEDVETFERCISVGGVAIFPADTVYGLATEPDSREGVERLYRLKGRLPDKPSAVMFFQVETALAALPELGERTRAVVESLLPGPVTILLPNPAHRFSLACATEPDRIGIRVPALEGALAPLRAARWPVLQSSANLAGEPDARRVEDIAPGVRAGVDMVLDGGELPGTPSTVVDFSPWEEGGTFEVIREGALPVEAMVRSIR